MISKFNLSKVYDIPKWKQKDLRAEFESNVEITLEKEGNYTITVWDTDKQRAADISNAYVAAANAHFVEIFRQDNFLSKNYFDQRIQSLDSIIAALGTRLKNFSEKLCYSHPKNKLKQLLNQFRI